MKIGKIFESLIDEDYPVDFNIEEFKQLTSFASRIMYCEKRLRRISSGSSRIVYQIDEEKVLKLAKNNKGIAQNEVEIEYGNDNYLSHILAGVFNNDENNLWVEMELARKLKANDFKSIIGISFQDFCKGVFNHAIDVSPQKMRGFSKYKMPDGMNDFMWENEFIYNIFDYMGSYDIPHGDLVRTSSYGIVKRDGADTVVLIDYGLTNDVSASYYS